MKTSKYQRRFYRSWVSTKDLYLMRVAIKETDLQILTDRPVDKNFVAEQINLYRRQIEAYIAEDGRFFTALKPIEVELTAAPIVKEMSRAARKANVGPMAAVAGAIAQFLGEDLLKKGYKEVIVENGGDIFLKTVKTRNIRIYAGGSKLWQGLGLKIKSKDTPLGICTSSGRIGHSLSFGLADAAIILSKNVSLADATATATANIIKSKLDLQKALGFARAIRGIRSVIIILKNNLISWGNVEFTK